MHDPPLASSLQETGSLETGGISAGILAAVSDAVLIWDKTTQIVACSDKIVPQLGFSRAEILGQPLTDLFSPREAPANWKERLSRGGERLSGFVRTATGISQAVELEITEVSQGEGRFFIGVLSPESDQIYVLHEDAQAALDKTTELARAFLRAPTDLALVIDAAGTILTHNETAASLLGRRPGELARQRLYDLLPPQTAEQCQSCVESVLNGASSASLEWQQDDKWLDAVIAPLGPNSKNITIFARLITERKQNENRTLRLTRFYAVLSQINKIGIRAQDAQTLYTETCRIFVEEGGLRMAWIGLPDPDTLLVQPAAIYGHNDGYVEGIRIFISETSEGKGPTGIAMRTGTPSLCQDIATDIRMKPWRDAALERGYRASAAFPLRINDRIVGALNLYADSPHFFDPDLVQLFIALADDISFAAYTIEQKTIREKTTDALRRSETRFRTLVEHAADGIFIADAQGNYVEVNTAGCKLLGYEREDILKMHVRDLVISRTTPRVQERLNEVAEGDAILTETEYRHRNGDRIPVEISAKVLPDGRFLGIIRDISERKSSENALRTYSRQLELLQAANLSLMNTLELDIVLQTLLHFLAEFVPYDTANVMLLDEHGYAHLSAGEGYEEWSDSVAVRHLVFDTQTFPSFQTIIQTRRSLLIPDTTAYDGWIDDPLTAHVRSWLGVPLIAGGKVIGFYSIYKNVPNFFTQAHIQMVESLSAQAAVAIENARFYEENRRRTAELETLSDLTISLRRTTTIDAMLSVFVERMTTYLDGKQGYIAQTDNTCSELIITESYPPHPGATGRRFSPNAATRRQLAESAEVRICPEPLLASPDGVLIQKMACLENTGTSVWMPLRSQNETLGFLEVILPQHRNFAERERQLLAAFAEVGSITFARLRFQKTLERGVDERTREIYRRQQVAEGLRYILSILNSGRPFEEVLTYIVTQACWLLDTTTGAIFRWQGMEAPIAVQVTYGLSENDKAIHLPAAQAAVTQASRTRQPVAVPDLLAIDSSAGAEPESPLEYRALLAAPLVLANEIYGCLALYFSESRTFSEEDTAIAVSFAAQATMAIENARLRADAEKSAVAAERNRLARELHDAVTQSLFAAGIIADVLPQIWESNPAAGIERLGELRKLTRGALAEMRALLLELRPKALSEVGLDVLLKQLTEAMSNRAQTPISLIVKNPRILEPDVQVGLYRIAQEALNNIAKHADANAIEVDLSFEPTLAGTSVRLSIRDNGRGFAVEDVSGQNLGLKIMRERADAIGATLDIRSTPGHGVHILVAWPETKENSS